VDVYGPQDGIVTVDTTPNPQTVYAKTKLRGEEAVLAANGIVVRCATIYGVSDRMRWDVLPHDFARKAVAGRISLYQGDATRVFLSIFKAGELLASSACHDTSSVRIILAADSVTTKLNLALHCASLTGCEVDTEDGYDHDARDWTVESDLDMDQQLDEILPDIIDLARVWR
jgi:nucleoside-diphosphate-sugar epimerase